MSIKKWFINPCNKCLVYGCCTNACNKLKLFVKHQATVWVSIGGIITIIILIPIVYKLYSIDIIFSIIFIIGWLIIGTLMYRSIAAPNKDNIFTVMFSFIWLPYLVLSVSIGALLALGFTKKRNIKFITGNIWKEKIN